MGRKTVDRKGNRRQQDKTVKRDEEMFIVPLKLSARAFSSNCPHPPPQLPALA